MQCFGQVHGFSLKIHQMYPNVLWVHCLSVDCSKITVVFEWEVILQNLFAPRDEKGQSGKWHLTGDAFSNLDSVIPKKKQTQHGSMGCMEVFCFWFCVSFLDPGKTECGELVCRNVQGVPFPLWATEPGSHERWLAPSGHPKSSASCCAWSRWSFGCLLCLLWHIMARGKCKTLTCSSSHPNLEMNQYHTTDGAPHVSWFASVFTIMSLSCWVVKGWWQATLTGRHTITRAKNWAGTRSTLSDVYFKIDPSDSTVNDTWYQWYLCKHVETGHTQPLETCLTSVNNRAKIQAVGQNPGDVGDLRWSCPPGRSNTTGSSAMFVVLCRCCVVGLWRAKKPPEIPSVNQWRHMFKNNLTWMGFSKLGQGVSQGSTAISSLFLRFVRAKSNNCSLSWKFSTKFACHVPTSPRPHVSILTTEGQTTDTGAEAEEAALPRAKAKMLCSLVTHRDISWSNVIWTNFTCYQGEVWQFGFLCASHVVESKRCKRNLGTLDFVTVIFYRQGNQRHSNCCNFTRHISMHSAFILTRRRPVSKAKKLDFCRSTRSWCLENTSAAWPHPPEGELYFETARHPFLSICHNFLTLNQIT